jgi:hypothetical protein
MSESQNQTAATAPEDFDAFTPPGLYNDRMDGSDQIDLEELVASMIHGAADEEGRVSEERASELGRRIVLTLLYRTRPDLFRDGQVDITQLLPVGHPEKRTAIVELDFEGAITDDLRLAENIADALRHECHSGNGLANEAGEGFTRQLRVWVGREYTTREV